MREPATSLSADVADMAIFVAIIVALFDVTPNERA